MRWFLLFLLLSSVDIFSQSARKDSLSHQKSTATKKKEIHNDTAKVIITKKEEIRTEGILTEEERRFYQSDILPLSLLQRGRLTTSAFRGMPAGFFQFNFAGNALTNPVMGFWNEQWLPHYRIEKRRQLSGEIGETYKTYAPRLKPETRVVYSQNYINWIAVSLLDIQFSKRLSPTNYIQLSGSNLKGRGFTILEDSKYQILNHFGQMHFQLSKRWQIDFFYSRIRHRFNMRASQKATDSKTELTAPPLERFGQRGYLSWINLQGKFMKYDSLVFVPGYTIIKDNYTTIAIDTNNHKTIDLKRNNHYQFFHSDLKYMLKFSKVYLGSQLYGRLFNNRVNNQAKSFWQKRDESDAHSSIFLKGNINNIDFYLKGGSYYHSETGSKKLVFASTAIRMGEDSKIGGAVFSQPQAVPLLWRTFKLDYIPLYSALSDPQKQFIVKEGINGILRLRFAKSFWLQLEPFTLKTRNYPILLDSASLKKNWRWETRDIENYGLKVVTGLKLWGVRIKNDFTYNQQYRQAFAPRINNITTLKTSLQLFKNALRLDGVFTWHYIGRFQTLDFNRLLYQYRINNKEGGRYSIGDFRLQAHFRDAILFFIWENMLSTDYFIINDTLEEVWSFRAGVRWHLFD